MAKKAEATVKPEETKTNKTKVKIIRKVGKDASLVEWVVNGLPFRATVPGNESSYSKDVLSAGVQHGVRWEEIEVKLDPGELAQELYKNDIWTLKDVMSNPNAVIGICMHVIGVNLTALMKHAKTEVKDA